MRVVLALGLLLVVSALAKPDINSILKSGNLLGSDLNYYAPDVHRDSGASGRIAASVFSLGFAGASEHAVELQKVKMGNKMRWEGTQYDKKMRKAVCEYTVCPIATFAATHGKRAAFNTATVLLQPRSTPSQKLTAAMTAQFTVLGLLDASQLMATARSEDGKEPCDCGAGDDKVTRGLIESLIDELLPLSGARVIESLAGSALSGKETDVDLSKEEFTRESTLAAITSEATLTKAREVLVKYKSKTWAIKLSSADPGAPAAGGAAGEASGRASGSAVDAILDTTKAAAGLVDTGGDVLDAVSGTHVGDAFDDLGLSEVSMAVSVIMSFRHVATMTRAAHAEDRDIAAKKLAKVVAGVLKGFAIWGLTALVGDPVGIGIAAVGLASHIAGIATVSYDADHVISGRMAGFNVAMQSVHQRTDHIRVICALASRSVAKLGPLAPTTHKELSRTAADLQSAVQMSCVWSPAAHGSPTDLVKEIVDRAATFETRGFTTLYTQTDKGFVRPGNFRLRYDNAGAFLKSGSQPSMSVSARSQRNRCYSMAKSAESTSEQCYDADTNLDWPDPPPKGAAVITDVTPYARAFPGAPSCSANCRYTSTPPDYLTAGGRFHAPVPTDSAPGVSELNFCTYCARDSLKGVQLQVVKQPFGAPVMSLATIDWGGPSSVDAMLPEDRAGLFSGSYFAEEDIFHRRYWAIKRTADLNFCLRAQNEGASWAIACNDHAMTLAVRKQFGLSSRELDGELVSKILAFAEKLEASTAPRAAAADAAAGGDSLLQVGDGAAAFEASFAAFDTDSDGTISARDIFLALENAGSFAVHKLHQRLGEWLAANKLEDVHGVAIADYVALSGPELTPDDMAVLSAAHERRAGLTSQECVASSHAAAAASAPAAAPGSQPTVSVETVCEVATLVTDLNRDCVVDLGDIAAGIREHEEIEAVRPPTGIKLKDEDLQQRDTVSLGSIAAVPKSVQDVAQTVGLTEAEPSLPASEFRDACLRAVGEHTDDRLSPEEYRRTRVVGLMDMSRAHAQTVEKTLGGNLEALVHPDVWPVLDKQWTLYAGAGAASVSLRDFAAVRAAQIPDVADMEAVVRYDFNEHFEVAEEDVLTRSEFFAAFVRDPRMRPGWANGVSEWKKEALVATVDLAAARAIAEAGGDETSGAGDARGGVLAASMGESADALHVTEAEYKQHVVAVLARAFGGVARLAPGAEDGTAKVPAVQGADVLLPGVSALVGRVCAPDCKPGAAAVHIRDGLVEGKSVGEYPALWRVQAFAFAVTATAADVSAAERAVDESVLRKSQRAALYQSLKAFGGSAQAEGHMSRESADVVSRIALGKTLDEAVADAGRLPKAVGDALAEGETSVAMSALLHIISNGVARSVSGGDELGSSERAFVRAMASRGLAHELAHTAKRMRKAAVRGAPSTPNLRASSQEPASGALEPSKML